MKRFYRNTEYRLQLKHLRTVKFLKSGNENKTLGEKLQLCRFTNKENVVHIP
jgi:hypothetical protein